MSGGIRGVGGVRVIGGWQGLYVLRARRDIGGIRGHWGLLGGVGVSRCFGGLAGL